MKINQNIRIIGNLCILIPYKEEHVPKYHKWMQSEELQELTRSEPLSLIEEYEMQKSWVYDEGKITFIVLDRKKFEETNDEIESMIGDTNLFFIKPEDKNCAEAEVMIAEKTARGHGCGTEAMLLMMLYGIMNLSVKQYIVKIANDNLVSINMFKNFGFELISESNVFEEITLGKMVDDEWIEWINKKVKSYKIENIHESTGDC